MREISIQFPPSTATEYPIFVGIEHREQLLLFLETHFPKHQCVIITDETVQKIYGDALAKALIEVGRSVVLLAFAAGEHSKIAATKEALEGEMLRRECGRDTIVLALGGGVVGDMAGFVAATYMRGIPYIQIPTTLLAMVDSSIGGKTGINTPYGKNLIGAFWQPQAVFVDISYLETLEKKELINGLVEAVKMFFTNALEEFHFVEEHLNSILNLEEVVLEKVIAAAITIKKEIVERDERESGERMLLNFGHTIGHALEHVSDYHFSHGEAVALGILVELKISELLGKTSREEYERGASFLKRLGIVPALLDPYDPLAIIAATKNDKKTVAGQARYILLRGLGKAYKTGGAIAHVVNDAVVKESLAQVLLS